MRYILLGILAYLAYKSVRRFFQNFQIVDKESDKIRGKNADTGPSRYIDKDDIEDAEFKDLD